MKMRRIIPQLIGTRIIKSKRPRLHDCDTATAGYLNLITKKIDGDERSYLQDAFINAGFMYGEYIQEELYNECPPKKYKNTMLRDILQCPVIKRNFQIVKEINYTMEKGGKEYVLLHNRIRTGLYIVWCKAASRMTTDDSPFEDHHP